MTDAIARGCSAASVGDVVRVLGWLLRLWAESIRCGREHPAYRMLSSGGDALAWVAYSPVADLLTRHAA